MEKSVMSFALMLISLVAIAGLITFSVQQGMPQNDIQDIDLKQFASQEEFDAFLNDTGIQASRSFMFGGGEMVTMAESLDSSAGDGAAAPQKTSADDYSTTNIQVEGVDEADIVKNDGKYIYVATGTKVVILDAYPADDMKVLAEINFTNNINELFINGDKLVVFGNGIAEKPITYCEDDAYDLDCVCKEGEKELYQCPEGECAAVVSYICVEPTKIDDGGETVPGEMPVEDLMKSIVAPDYYYPRSYDPAVLTYDISDKENPVLENTVILDGNYVNARMIGDHVYVVSNKYVYMGVEPPIYYVNGVEKSVAVTDVYYPEYYDDGYQFTSVSAIDLDSGEINTETYLLGTSYTMYASQNNIYLTQYKSANYEDAMRIMVEEVHMKLVPEEYQNRLAEVLDGDEDYWEIDDEINDIMGEWAESLEEGEDMGDFEELAEELMENAQARISKLQGTAIYKIKLDKMDIDYIASGFVPGNLLDQFSMDEHKGNLRVATTTGNNWWFGMSSESSNNMYVLDDDLDIIGSVEGLAPGERVYSSRFMGDKAYMVTFRQVDPLFVMDLSDPKNPEVLGELKITGVSEYLHPYDEDHIIGIGREATEEGRFLGMKISLFDVSDVANPIEVAKIEIGDRGTRSDALNDHKAVLFDKEKNLLVLPIDLYEADDEKSWGSFVWQGAMVLDISPEGISERGRITHREHEADDDGYYYRQWQSSIRRSLYMDDVLYTISSTTVKANYLDSLDEIKEVEISDGDDGYYYGGGFGGIEIMPMIDTLESF